MSDQSHVFCRIHLLPLIESTGRDKKCSCGRNEFYRCCNYECSVVLCKKCLKTYDAESTTFIADTDPIDIDDNNSVDSDELVEPYDMFIENEEEKDDDYIDNGDGGLGFNVDDDDHDMDNFMTNPLKAEASPEEDEFDGDDEVMEEGVNIISASDIAGDIPTTNAGQVLMEVEEMVTEYGGTFGNIRISGHVILNQVGTLLTRKKYQLKGSSRHRFFLQRLCATAPGSSIPLMYPEGALFPSIHWKMAPDNCAVVGCLPVPLLIDERFNKRFASIQDHIRSRVTNPGVATSTDSRYISHCYDVLTNVAANHEDTRLILNRGLTVNDDKFGGLCVRGKKDSSLTGSIDSKQMVRNLCYSEKYHKWSHFLTFTCNQKNHFGTAPIKNWMDDDG